MRLGLLADIHGDVRNLSLAIEKLRNQRVDKFVLLGDVIYDTNNADETVALLKSCGAVGVWGNHELGLCVDPEEDVRQLYSETVMQFFGTLRPSLELGNVLVSHTFPTENASEVLSYYVGFPEEDGLRRECFESFSHRVMAIGHFHCWFAATRDQVLRWHGEQPLSMTPAERYFVVIGAVSDGFAAVLDCENNSLIPISL